MTRRCKYLQLARCKLLTHIFDMPYLSEKDMTQQMLMDIPWAIATVVKGR